MNEFSKKKYNILIGLTLLYGFVINIIEYVCFSNIKLNPLLLLVGYLISATMGLLLCTYVDGARMKFLGYNLMAVPIGLVLINVLDGYNTGIVIEALLITSLVCFLMICISTIKPEIFESMGKTLFVTLLGATIIEFVICIIGSSTPQWLNVLIALIFSGYIGYDWSRAQDSNRNLENVVLAAALLYVDIINLFIKILAIISKEKSKNK